MDKITPLKTGFGLADLLKTGFGLAALKDTSDFNTLESLKGMVVNGYIVDSLIGEGGMSRVYMAHRNDGTFERTVAIKFLIPSALTEDVQLSFIAEAQILADMTHPNIGRMFDAGITENNSLHCA